MNPRLKQMWQPWQEASGDRAARRSPREPRSGSCQGSTDTRHEPRPKQTGHRGDIEKTGVASSVQRQRESWGSTGD